VTYTSPGAGDVNVPLDSQVEVVFSEQMRPSSLTANSFQLTRPAKIVAMAAGEYHTMLLKDDGTVVAWGDNSYGQGNVPDAAIDVVALAAGNSHSLALTRNGTVVAWGTTATARPTFRPSPIQQKR
jgi:alpha-tubulin suppressor-like RCC1 family protein